MVSLLTGCKIALWGFLSGVIGISPAATYLLGVGGATDAVELCLDRVPAPGRLSADGSLCGGGGAFGNCEHLESVSEYTSSDFS